MKIYKNLDIFIDDNPMLTIPALRTRARRLFRKHNIDVIIIDYLQLMSGSDNKRNDGRVQEISEITRGLKIHSKRIKYTNYCAFSAIKTSRAKRR